jgi:adenosine deaminase
VNKDSTNNLEEIVQRIPKVELHLHLEGAIPLDALFNLIQLKGTEPSIKNVDDLRRKLIYIDFEHFINLWSWKNTFIRNENDFEEITYQVLNNLARQNVKYAEITYSPSDYRRKNFAAPAITEYVISGKEKAFRDFGILSALILDVVRDRGPARAMQELKELTPYLGKGLIGITIGGREHLFPAEPFADVYKAAKQRGFRLTAHAGEAAGADSIRAAIEKLGVERVGHGVRAYEDSKLVSLLKERRIPLELCVISNIRTGVCKSIETHPVKQYFQKGLMVTINSDDPTMFNTSISQEYSVLVQKLGFTLSDLKQLSMNGIRASFMPDKAKTVMAAQFEKEWEQLGCQ